MSIEAGKTQQQICLNSSRLRQVNLSAITVDSWAKLKLVLGKSTDDPDPLFVQMQRKRQSKEGC